ncbi:MAG: metal ABC transporter substrate-binding protein [Syntrophobacteraceae bacterium]|nr:metal ABC transporter substrate-binding protein [Syntrophobacteraceae bacterium]
MLVLLSADPGVTASSQGSGDSGLKVLAIETFLAHIAQHVAGERTRVDALLPVGADPHSFEPTPADVARVAESNVLVIHGAGLEEFLDQLLRNAGGTRRVIDVSAGLESRSPRKGEVAEAHGKHHHDEAEHHHHEGDPHFWLSPIHVMTYVTTVRDGLSQSDPAGAAIYAANAEAYIARLKELDQWIFDQVKQVPEKDRLLVTNHMSFGYFADRYGFRIVGTIMPGVSTGASPSAKELARLTKKIKATGAKAIFLETGTNPRLADQVARETKIRVVTELFTHSLTEPGGPAPTYIDMMKYNTTAIVNALK